MLIERALIEFAGCSYALLFLQVRTHYTIRKLKQLLQQWNDCTRGLQRKTWTVRVKTGGKHVQRVFRENSSKLYVYTVCVRECRVSCLCSASRKTNKTDTLSIHTTGRRPERRNYSRARMRPVVLYAHTYRAHAVVHSKYTFEKLSVSSSIRTHMPSEFQHRLSSTQQILLACSYTFTCITLDASETCSWQVVTRLV